MIAPRDWPTGRDSESEATEQQQKVLARVLGYPLREQWRDVWIVGPGHHLILDLARCPFLQTRCRSLPSPWVCPEFIPEALTAVMDQARVYTAREPAGQGRWISLQSHQPYRAFLSYAKHPLGLDRYFAIPAVVFVVPFSTRQSVHGFESILSDFSLVPLKETCVHSISSNKTRRS